MAVTIITIESALTIVAQLIPMIQTAYSTGTPIDAAAWANAIAGRDAALSKLDADIAASK